MYRSFQIGNIEAFRTSGTEFEMAKDHFTHFRDQIPKGPLPYMYEKPLKEATKLKILQNRFLKKAAEFALDQIFFSPMSKSLPRSADSIFEAASEVLDIPSNAMRRAYLIPDFLALGSKLSFGSYRMPQLPTFGCSSFVVEKEKTAQGRMLQGRNLDFPGVGLWDANPLLLALAPKHGQRILSFTATGAHQYGITVMNESGLIFAIHQVFSTRTRKKNMTIIALVENAAKRARTLSQAIDTLKNTKPISGWAIVVSDYKENTAVCVEMDAKSTYVRPMEDGYLTVGNYFTDEKMRKKELFLSHSMEVDDMVRPERLRQLIAQSKGQITPENAAQFLADDFDPIFQTHRAVGRTLATIYTTQSMVFEPESRSVWFATGQAPTSQSPFVKVSFDEFFKEALEDETPQDRQHLQPRSTLTETQLKARKRYIQAYTTYFDKSDPAEAFSYLREAADLDPKELSYQMVTSFLTTLLNRPHEALDAAENAEALLDEIRQKTDPSSNYFEDQIVALFRGRALDLLGRREEAVASYKRFFQDVSSPKIKKALKKGIRKPFTSKACSKIQVQFEQADCFVY